MPISVTFECGGCRAVAAGTGPLRQRISQEPVSSTWDRVTVQPPLVESIAPDGWMPFDPYSHCTYCPECWAGIISEPVASETDT